MGFENRFGEFPQNGENSDNAKKSGGEGVSKDGEFTNEKSGSGRENEAGKGEDKELDFTRYGKEFSEEIRMSVEKRSAKLMSEAKTFSELREIIIKEKIALEGSKRKFKPTELIEVIDDIRAGKLSPRAATRTAGFREIVKSLAEKEGISVIEREQNPKSG